MASNLEAMASVLLAILSLQWHTPGEVRSIASARARGAQQRPSLFRANACDVDGNCGTVEKSVSLNNKATPQQRRVPGFKTPTGALGYRNDSSSLPLMSLAWAFCLSPSYIRTPLLRSGAAAALGSFGAALCCPEGRTTTQSHTLHGTGSPMPPQVQTPPKQPPPVAVLKAYRQSQVQVVSGTPKTTCSGRQTGPSSPRGGRALRVVWQTAQPRSVPATRQTCLVHLAARSERRSEPWLGVDLEGLGMVLRSLTQTLHGTAIGLPISWGGARGVNGAA